MFFIVSKLFWIVAAPSNLVFWLVIATAALLLFKQWRWAERTSIAAAILLVLFGVLPTWELAIRPLEDSYPRPRMPARVDGIVVLGPGLSPGILLSRGAPASNPGLSRLVSAYTLARRFPKARVVFSGGSGALAGNLMPDTKAAKILFTDMGLDPKRLTLEGKSRNTWENLDLSKRLVKPRPGEHWVLATSASHMPRAMAVARRLGWTMIPWPTDYTTPRHGVVWTFDIPNNLAMMDKAVHEWIGLAVYRMTGRAARGDRTGRSQSSLIPS